MTGRERPKTRKLLRKRRVKRKQKVFALHSKRLANVKRARTVISRTLRQTLQMLRNRQETYQSEHQETLSLQHCASTSRQETSAPTQSADFHMANNCRLLPRTNQRRTGKSQTEADANPPVNEALSEKKTEKRKVLQKDVLTLT